MTKSHTMHPKGCGFRGWIIALVTIAIWFAIASQSARAQEVRIPEFVLAQVLGTVPPPASSPTTAIGEQGLSENPAASVVPAADPSVALVAHRMQQDLRDQLVAGVARPNVDLEVHFEWDSAQIRQASTPEIEAVASLLNGHFPRTRFRLAGFTDRSGDADYNQALSERRAIAVWAVLVEEHGVAAERLEAVGYGEEDPALESSDEERRRVELQILRSEADSF